MNLFRDALIIEAQRHGIAVMPEALETCLRHYALLLKWNPRVRLVGSVEPERAAVELFADSLMAARFAASLVAEPTARIAVVDIGAGGGFPGIVVQVARPQWRLTLIDSNAKKVSFLKTAIRELALTETVVTRGRAEELAQMENFSQKFDFAFCRAVAPPEVALKLALPFLKAGGLFVAQTGAMEGETLSFGGKKDAVAVIEKTETYRLTGVATERKLIAIKKPQE
ncbi:16S rRNA (guanine(527)-N(7))-methyltransferase RsmG [Candidatus Poribacteria bacterium]|nr:16S rRNA (guanine(527)-N(7))-methyltransferase RsmG [Candidatus Poribacteria bacterium]